MPKKKSLKMQDRIYQVFRLYQMGESPKEIAQELGVHPSTIYRYLTRIKNHSNEFSYVKEELSRDLKTQIQIAHNELVKEDLKNEVEINEKSIMEQIDPVIDDIIKISEKLKEAGIECSVQEAIKIRNNIKSIYESKLKIETLDWKTYEIYLIHLLKNATPTVQIAKELREYLSVSLNEAQAILSMENFKQKLAEIEEEIEYAKICKPD